MPIPSILAPSARGQSPPRPKAPRDEERPERGRQPIKKYKRHYQTELLHHVFAEGVLAGQCAGRNLEENKNDDCHRYGRDSSHLQAIATKITNDCAKSTAN